MLSYEQIGPAAMMSRACAGLVAGRIVVALAGIGSRGAPGDGAAADPRARPPRPRGDAIDGTGDTASCARSPRTISLDEARRRLAAAIRPIARTERVALARRRRPRRGRAT